MKTEEKADIKQMRRLFMFDNYRDQMDSLPSLISVIRESKSPLTMFSRKAQ